MFNSAIKLVTEGYIIITDADCRIDPQWLHGIAGICKITGAELVIGEVDMKDSGGLFSKMLNLEYLSLQAITAATAWSGHPVLCSGANLCFKKDCASDYLNSVRGDIASGDDMFLLHDIKRRNGKIVFSNDETTRVVTGTPISLRTFLRQRMRWAGKGLKYRDRDTIVLASLVFITNTLIIAMLALATVYPEFLMGAGLLFLWKSITDLTLLSRYARQRNRLGLLICFIPVQLIYPFYVVISTISGLFLSPRWTIDRTD